jgi:class 3 adenylate cyclase
MVVIGENTYEIVRDQFECRSLGKSALKGKTNEVATYEVVAAKGGSAAAVASGGA